MPDGKNVDESDICPASTESRLDGIHGGKNAGRCCWVIAGTMCGKDVQGTFAKKFKECLKCNFFQLVRKEEFSHYIMSTALLKILNLSSETTQ